MQNQQSENLSNQIFSSKGGKSTPSARTFLSPTLEWIERKEEEEERKRMGWEGTLNIKYIIIII
jgi:hypothetical protein